MQLPTNRSGSIRLYETWRRRDRVKRETLANYVRLFEGCQGPLQMPAIRFAFVQQVVREEGRSIILLDPGITDSRVTLWYANGLPTSLGKCAGTPHLRSKGYEAERGHYWQAGVRLR